MTNPKPRGPWFHRFLIWLFAIGVAVLSFWLLGYIVRDIDAIQGPDYQAMESSILDAALVDRRESLSDEVDDTQRSIANLNERRLLLKNTKRGYGPGTWVIYFMFMSLPLTDGGG